MSVTAVVGANWGDEGKGKLCDALAAQSDYVVRFQGGNNAGHTVINTYGKFSLHLLPSGVFYNHVVNVLGPGVAVNPPALLKELAGLQERGVPAPQLCISDRAQVIMTYHKLFDAYEEERLAGAAFGSTRMGIAPFYADKAIKAGIQVNELFDRDRLRSRISAAITAKNTLLEQLYRRPALRLDEVVDEVAAWGEQIEPFVCDTTNILQKALAAGKRILLEGQLGALRDPDHGIFPYSTSSSPLAGFASVGAGVPPQAITRIIAVAKAYSTCVGAGPFVTELHGAEADDLRKRGGSAGEYGATTGRPRSVGWFDAVATRYGCRIQAATEVALSLLDVLGYLDEIPVCTAYEINETRTNDFPVTRRLPSARPVYERMKGWKRDISGAKRFDDLPEEARAYARRVEELIETPVRWISVGPRREQLICPEA